MSKSHTVEVPKDLFNEILPNLFMGGTADEDTIDVPQSLKMFENSNEFDCVVTLYAWASPVNWGVEERRFGFPDAEIISSYLDSLHEMADWAHAKWKAGKKVLIRCQAGLNRSGIIMALVLMKEGFTPEQAITVIREKRSEWALYNTSYVNYLNSLEV